MNASSLSAFESAAHAARVGLWGDAVLIGGQSYPAAVILGGSTLENEAGGPMPVQTASVEISKTALTTAPAKGSGVTVDGRVYTLIETLGEGATHAAWLLRCYRKLP